MKTKTESLKSLGPFKRSSFASVDKPLIINKSKILALTEKLKIEESVESLRNSVLDLESNLRSVKNDKVGVLNIDLNGDTISIHACAVLLQ